MVRTQIQLTEMQTIILKQLAQQQQVSMAELIRRSIDLYIASVDERPLDEKYAQALTLAGKYRSGDTDLGRRHDKYLADAFAVLGE